MILDRKNERIKTELERFLDEDTSSVQKSLATGDETKKPAPPKKFSDNHSDYFLIEHGYTSINPKYFDGIFLTVVNLRNQLRIANQATFITSWYQSNFAQEELWNLFLDAYDRDRTRTPQECLTFARNNISQQRYQLIQKKPGWCGRNLSIELIESIQPFTTTISEKTGLMADGDLEAQKIQRLY